LTICNQNHLLYSKVSAISILSIVVSAAIDVKSCSSYSAGPTFSVAGTNAVAIVIKDSGVDCLILILWQLVKRSLNS